MSDAYAAVVAEMRAGRPVAMYLALKKELTENEQVALTTATIQAFEDRIVALEGKRDHRETIAGVPIADLYKPISKDAA